MKYVVKLTEDQLDNLKTLISHQLENEKEQLNEVRRDSGYTDNEVYTQSKLVVDLKDALEVLDQADEYEDDADDSQAVRVDLPSGKILFVKEYR